MAPIEDLIILRLKLCYPFAGHLLNKDWRLANAASGIASTGFCYIATEALYHLVPQKHKWKPMCATYFEGEGKVRCTHWWLQHRTNNQILDPTDCQYGNDTPPYNKGRGMGFQNGYDKPSKRAKALIDIYNTILIQ